MATIGHPYGPLENIPLAIGIEKQIELRLNNALLDPATVKCGWLVFDASPAQLATGENLVGVRIADGDVSMIGRVLVEKLEVHVERATSADLDVPRRNDTVTR